MQVNVLQSTWWRSVIFLFGSLTNSFVTPFNTDYTSVQYAHILEIFKIFYQTTRPEWAFHDLRCFRYIVVFVRHARKRVFYVVNFAPSTCKASLLILLYDFVSLPIPLTQHSHIHVQANEWLSSVPPNSPLTHPRPASLPNQRNHIHIYYL